MHSSHTMTLKVDLHKEEEQGVSSLLKLSKSTIKDLTKLFKVLADPSRLKIVLALTQHGPMHVTALVALLGQTQPAVSHHLTLMRNVGVVGYDRNGKHNFYYLASDYLRELLERFFRDSENGEQALKFDEFTLEYTRLQD